MAAAWDEVRKHLREIAEACSELQRLGVLRSQRDLDVDLSEWYAEQLSGGKRADSPTQKSWDLELPDGTKVQVQKDNKANKWRGTFWVSDKKMAGLRDSDRLVLVQMNRDRSLEQVYDVPVCDVRNGNVGCYSGGGYTLFASDLREYMKSVGEFESL